MQKPVEPGIVVEDRSGGHVVVEDRSGGHFDTHLDDDRHSQHSMEKYWRAAAKSSR